MEHEHGIQQAEKQNLAYDIHRELAFLSHTVIRMFYDCEFFADEIVEGGGRIFMEVEEKAKELQKLIMEDSEHSIKQVRAS